VFVLGCDGLHSHESSSSVGQPRAKGDADSLHVVSGRHHCLGGTGVLCPIREVGGGPNGVGCTCEGGRAAEVGEGAVCHHRGVGCDRIR
jgi:hypothetical protein